LNIKNQNKIIFQHLTGSEKQTLWADKIRADKFALIEKAHNENLDNIDMNAYWGDAMSPDDSRLAHAITLLKNQISASWWIDNRDRKISNILVELFTQHPEQPDRIDDCQLKMQAESEATVRPESPETETVTEIRTLSDRITVHFHEKLEKFRLIMRKHGFTWSEFYWERQLNARNGSVQNRAAEIGHTLLANGFIIRIYNESIRQAAISGTYQEEQTRWISVYTTGSNKGNLCISWSRDEDYYRAAKSLPTAKYVKPNIAVDIEHFEDILDFAEINGFSISDAAQNAIDAAEQIKEKSLVVHIEPIETEQRIKMSDKPEKLAVPDDVDINDELLDE